MGGAWHFQLAGMVGCFRSKSSFIDIDKFVEIYRQEHRHVFGWFEGSTRVSLPNELNE